MLLQNGRPYHHCSHTCLRSLFASIDADCLDQTKRKTNRSDKSGCWQFIWSLYICTRDRGAKTQDSHFSVQDQHSRFAASNRRTLNGYIIKVASENRRVLFAILFSTVDWSFDVAIFCHWAVTGSKQIAETTDTH